MCFFISSFFIKKNNHSNIINNINKINNISNSEIITWDNTTEFIVPIQGGIVVKVYDGDTITIASKLPYDESPLYRFSVRLNGIDTPEIKGKGISKEEKITAKEAANFVSNLIMNKYVILKNIQNEKYGRILADVYFTDDSDNEICLNELLIKERYAVKYDGGTKIKPKCWIKYRTTGEY